MNILHLTKYEAGGAGRAALRLHNSLLNANLDSKTLVQGRDSDLESVLTPPKEIEIYKLLQSELTSGVLKKFFHRTTPFSINVTPSFVIKKINSINPDIINLHWIGREFIKIEELQNLKAPLVWTMHDMWPFTGGCHYSGECDRYVNSCGVCPQLGNSNESDLTRWVYKRKSKAWNNLNLTVVSPSNWLADCAKSSSLFQNLRIEVIPNGLDIHKYKPWGRETARKFLNLPQDKQLILFGAFSATQDTRKGFQLLQPALQKLRETGWSETLELVVFGASQPENPPEFGFKAHYLGTLSDDLSLALLYSAADVFVSPSVQDNLPNTVMEAIACGTPCVAFKIGGMPDMIEHQKNGYLAQPYQIEDLAQGIAWVLEDKDRHQKLAYCAREKAEKEFSLEVQSRRYLSLYKDIDYTN